MNQKSLELWKQRIADRKSSGLNVTDWCEKNNLTKHAYYYWWKRVEADAQKFDTPEPGAVISQDSFYLGFTGI